MMVETAARHRDHLTRKMGRRRTRRQDLRDPTRRGADRGDFPITPGLGCDPLDRVIAVLLFAPGVGQEWHIILAFGGEPSTKVLPDHCIAFVEVADRNTAAQLVIRGSV